MARPKKVGLDYFPFDTDTDQDDKMYMIKAEYGWEGFGIVVKLLCEVYREDGYFMEWDERKAKIFALKNVIDLDKLNGIMDVCLEEGLFNKKMYEEHQVLTSTGIQKRYMEATTRRTGINFNENYTLVDVNVYRNPAEPKKKKQHVAESTQIKEKEIKQEKSKKEDKIKYAEFVSMLEKEFNKLVKEHGETTTMKMIEKLDNYKGSTGKTYKSDYRAILSWVVEDFKNVNIGTHKKQNDIYKKDRDVESKVDGTLF